MKEETIEEMMEMNCHQLTTALLTRGRGKKIFPKHVYVVCKNYYLHDVVDYTLGVVLIY